MYNKNEKWTIWNRGLRLWSNGKKMAEFNVKCEK